MKQYSPTHRFYSFKDDFREPFARDRDRIIHCSSFRRLEYKTQVFLNIEGDYFRTRLTHSIEVSQIARAIAKHCDLCEDLAEAIALAHDLGHSPFGHSGGDELDRILKESGFKNGFEHNFQSFRVISELEKRYKDFNGLNLTFATLEGVLKHSTPYKKPFFSKNLNDAFSIELSPMLEAMVVDLSDEIAYISHDIDDGIKHKLIEFEMLEENEIVRLLFENIAKEGIDRRDKIFKYRFVSSLICLLIEDVIKNYKTNKEIKYSPNIANSLSKLKQLLFKNLYRHEEIKRKMSFGKLCIRSLFDDFMNDRGLLPRELKDKIDAGFKHHRIVSDYIASMTDRFAIKLYKELHIG
ncbi:dGTP triphosphohydrolase [Helicobacter sp. MIT 14-3879]|uniref:dGTP triphosphohydrolase n=1 Tax=Helicobacter sp. MIT 14-3879 TaxID=2040649 RepID=UPI000E1F40CA|nr:dNTP triphosphohydrolase [Helicobacter sp. MIT 14-3879]RDU61634.1 deoxyguanosinetriphosphate triphosphohydrolase [Helicobacter sp. MIT 14-3879]